MKKVCLILCAVLLVSAISACGAQSVGVIGGADGPTSVFVSGSADVRLITAEEAEQAALAHAGLTADDVIFERTELGADDGVLHYDVEFRSGMTEYEYEINAETGAVISFDKDR